MKKLMSIVCAALLVMSTAVTVFAQQSIVITGVVQNAQSATDASGNAVEVTVGDLESQLDAATVQQIISDLQNSDLVSGLLGDDYVEGMQVVDVKEVSVPENTTFPVTISFEVPGVSADSSVGILHYTADNEWEKIEAEAGDGTISGVFNSLSPVAFVVDQGAAAASATSSVSPKTGEGNTAAWAGAIAVLAFAGLVVTARKNMRK